ncbi:ATP-grasp fold amidoligase family protein [Mycobacterium sp.]|uniref:ATP-grasp fold amidoligase family protein n=1 Tax=Mycobacterium sp. TaxID=1785 RepID=UPI002DAFB1C0|nr:ATP-grasp fold amidoligase family protein [Mycobacterium sp.]
MPLLMNKTAPSMLLAAHRRLLGVLPVPLVRHAFHLTMIHKPGNFRQPRTFNEKVNWRILYDRRDRIVAACDKMRMKAMARAAYLGADLRIPETYWYGTDLRDAPDLAGLPPWVLKPNHSSGHVVLGPDPQTDVAALLEQTRDWWKRTPLELGEWGYGEARPLLLLEERIPTRDGSPPADYKFFVFDGRVELIQVNRGRFDDQTATFLDADWNRLPVRWRIRPVADEPRPAELDTMLEIARTLGSGWDFIRVDLYAVDGSVWFGEYTPYPGGGLLRYTPRQFDAEQGRHWQLPAPEQVRRGQP